MGVSAARRERTDAPEVARRLAESLGGRFSCELGIDLDAGGTRVDEWFLAAPLFGTRIAARSAMRTYRVFADAGVRTRPDNSTSCETSRVARISTCAISKPASCDARSRTVTCARVQAMDDAAR